MKVKFLHPDALVPQYATPGSAGFDLAAIEQVFLLPGETKLVATGLAIDVGEGYELQIRPRSGLSFKTALRIPNAPGTVDSDYRGEIKVILHNTSTTMAAKIKKGDRIAQGVVCAVTTVTFEVVETLDETQRGDGGLGSTGQ